MTNGSMTPNILSQDTYKGSCIQEEGNVSAKHLSLDVVQRK